MAYQNSTLSFEKMLLKFLTAQDPMLEMLKWLCEQLMEAELSNQLGADKTERSGSRNGYRAGYRPRRFDTRMGTMYLMVPKGELECTIEILNGHVVCDLIWPDIRVLPTKTKERSAFYLE